MKFGIFYEHQLPRPWTVDSEYNLIQNALEQIQYADSIGIEEERPWGIEVGYCLLLQGICRQACSAQRGISASRPARSMYAAPR